jgi:hypothetical protein
MISDAEAEKLRSIRAARPEVLSLYLRVPLNPSELADLPARAAVLISAAGTAAPQGSERAVVPARDREAVLAAVMTWGREWLGSTLAIFACGELGLLKTVPLPCPLPERAVLATRPHLRPLLAARQRCPGYRVAVIDQQHGWLISVTDDAVETAGLPGHGTVRSHGFGGWHGLDAYQAHHRITELARHHHHELAAVLARDVLAGDTRPLVVGGHLTTAPHLLRLLPPSAAALYAGSFAADPHTLTTARARQLAVGIAAEWVVRRERQAVAEVTVPGQGAGHRAGGQRADAVPGLPGSLAAVNAGMVRLLLIPDEEMVPGFVCSRCGDLSLTGAECPDWGAASEPVPDLLEEMAVRVLDGGGEVMTVRGPPWQAAARLRFPVPTEGTPRGTACGHHATARAEPVAPAPA